MATIGSVLFLITLSTTTITGETATVRGIPMERLSFYNPEEDFSCLDGSNKVPFSMVNDDYCDCLDGSDEPGTSACANGKYYCLNKGYVGKELVSSMVNDGICDCCDGSDEYLSNHCVNSCDELGKKMQEELEKKRFAQEAGYRARQEYSNAGLQKKKEKEETLAKLKVDKEALEAEVKSLREAKEEAEAPEKVAKDEHDQKVKELRDTKSSEKKKTDATKAFMKLDTNQDNQITEEELQSYVELDMDGDGTVSREEISEILGPDPLTFETFLETGYSALSEKVNLDTDTEDDHEGSPDESIDLPYDEATQQLIDVADKARESYQEAERREREVDSSISDVEKYLGIDKGISEEFAQLYGNCYEYTDREYVYKLCPFDKVTQRSKSGGRETSLGTWDNWNGEGQSKYNSMKYSNGEHCWNGPHRSTVVTLKCGAEESLVSASEPNRCEYAMGLLTPAVCEPFDPNRHFMHEEL
jgi:protein kinase C substrate 80K-H